MQLFCISIQAVALHFPHSKLNFTIENDWNLIPTTDGQLYMMHRDEILKSEIDPHFDAVTDVEFSLYTHGNPEGEIVQLGNAFSLTESNFNKNHPTRFVIHGWNGNRGSGMNRIIRNAYLQIGNFNIVVVDWSAGDTNTNYLTARSRVSSVGEAVALFIDFLVNTGGASYSDIYIAGHSLGAHVAGFAGKNTALPIRFISGLDPAGPLFSLNSPNERIDAADADYVEIIHTNGNILGFGDPIGDADFYPNGGNSQPGCGSDTLGSCAHGRSVSFFTESITTNVGFVSVPCSVSEIRAEECTESGPSVLMGGEPSNYGRNVFGTFFLTTSDASPFALG